MAEVEMLLEAYYMNLDSTWNKLTDISESVDDTEVMRHLAWSHQHRTWQSSNARL